MAILPAYSNALFENEILKPVEEYGKKVKYKKSNRVVYEVETHVVPAVFIALDRVPSILGSGLSARYVLECTRRCL